jgi:hypothetical protein
VSEAGSSKGTQSEEIIETSSDAASDTNIAMETANRQSQTVTPTPTTMASAPHAAAPTSPPAASEPSKVNVWDQRRKEQDSRKVEKTSTSFASGHGDAAVPPVRKTATVSVAGRGGAWAAGAPKRVEVDAQSSSSRKNRDKPLPTSIDAMPKLEEKSTKDWSNANKFSTLMKDADNYETEETAGDLDE